MGQRLLIVDGDRRFIKDHQIALEAAFDVDFLFTTDGALTQLEGGDYAAALVCVEVSENKGYALCSAIRKQPKLVDLKVALISAKATEEEYARHRSLKGKADLYLHKPLISSALVAALTPLVPPRSVDLDNPLGDLSGADLGDEWLESLKAELDTDEKPEPPLAAPAPRPALMTLPLPAVLPKVPQVAPDSGKVELLEARVKDLEGKLQDLGETLARRDQELLALQDRHDSVTRNLDDLESRRGEADLLQQRLVDTEARAQAAEAELAETREASAGLSRALEDAQSDQHRLQGLVDDLGQKLSTAERDLSGLREAQQAAEGLSSELQALHGQLQAKQAELDQLREAAQAAELLRERNQSLEGRIRELEEESTGIRAEMDRALSEAAGRIQAAESLVREQETALQDLQGRVAVQTELEIQLLEAREERGRQEARAEQMQAQRDAKAQELVEKDSEVESLKVDVAGLEATLRAQRRELADQGGRLGALTREGEGLQARLGQQEARIQELAEALSGKMQLLAEREHELSELRAQYRLIEEQLAGHARTLEEREHDVAQLRNTKEQLELHCEELDREISRITTQHEAQQLELMKGVDERDAQIGRLNEEVAGMQERHAGLEREKQSLEGSLNERSARLEALTSAISDLENSIRRASDLTRPF